MEAAKPRLESAARRKAWSEVTVRVVASVTLLYSMYYIWWRWTHSLNGDALWFSLPLALAETWGALTFAGLVFTTWKLRVRPPVPAPEGLRVAVFVTIYNEPISVLQRTGVAAREIAYPHETYFLDDGRRAEVKRLAQELGVRYISRETNEHAKAGNLNHALELTDEDFILQLDADHAPLPHIVDRLLGYFQDEKVAFVQSPQDFYNFDSFTHVMDEKGQRMWEEQRLFFSVIQPGKDRWNAAFFCGSCGMIRRAALDQIGGFATQTITEDVEISLILHSRGWKSAYVAESLAFGLSPGSLLPYQVQRLRWGQGSMQLLRKLNPLFLKGLTLPQRISYFISLVHYFDGVQRLIFIATPMLFFLTGVLPVVAIEREFLARLFTYIFLVVASFELLARGHGYLWISERFQMVRWPVYLRAVAGLFASKPLSFAVTPKGDASRTPVRAYLPQLLLLILAPVVLLWATVASANGWIYYGTTSPWRSGAFLLATFWLVWNGYFAWQVVKMARTMRQAENCSFREAVPIRFHLNGRTGLDAQPGLAMTHELGCSGLRFLSTTPIELMERLSLHLPLSTGGWGLEGRVTQREEAERAGIRLFDYLVEFEKLPFETQIGIELHCLHHAVPARTRQQLSRPDLFQDVRLWLRQRRKAGRERVNLPAQIRVLQEGIAAGRWYPAVLENLSPHGVLLVSDQPTAKHTRVQCQIPGAVMAFEGIVSYVRLVDTPRGCLWALGVHCTVPVSDAVGDVLRAPQSLAAAEPEVLVSTHSIAIPTARATSARGDGATAVRREESQHR